MASCSGQRDQNHSCKNTHKQAKTLVKTIEHCMAEGKEKQQDSKVQTENDAKQHL
jgi:hypothetical protein